MPEYYEVKRICSYLREAGIEGSTIQDLELLPGSEILLKQLPLPQWKKRLKNERILSIQTKAKYTFIQLSRGAMVWHYRFTGIPHMEGQNYGNKLYTIYNLPVDGSMQYCRFKLHLDGDKILSYLDTRCLSDIKYYPNTRIDELETYQKLAPDIGHFQVQPFSIWKKQQNKRKRDLKLELQDQFTAPSGIGNYLACEILAYAQLNPWLSVAQMTETQYNRLCQAIATVKQLCEKKATYRWFRVFNQQKCAFCKQPVLRQKHRLNRSSQTTHYCPNCQQEAPR
ncbi:DNA-formamidopyrimidine glycosylase family protein [Simkania sp.]|uniref:DNA-formamidopyrimidine glycosylase family protein n=1 Tax=Simkania sp. TaxID=34094 RepID=UPI003B5162A7